MNNRYAQPFGNPQLNSCLPLDLSASGRLTWKFTFNETEMTTRSRFLHLIDEKRAIIDVGNAFFPISLTDRNIIGLLSKSSNSFIRLAGGQRFFYFSGFRLVGVDFDFYNEELQGYFVPGLGDHAELYCLIPRERTFIAGVQNLGNPMYPENSFSLYEKSYDSIDEKWIQEFPGYVVPTPISGMGHIVIARKGVVTLMDSGGKFLKEFRGKFNPQACSIGPDNLIYLVCHTEDGTSLMVYNLETEKEWEIQISISEIVQPPIVGAESNVYLMGAGKAVMFRNTEKLWEYPVLSEYPVATVSKDGRLLIADGSRIVCLGQEGEEIWVYEDEDDDTFVTPPVMDENGKVLVASDRTIVMIE